MDSFLSLVASDLTARCGGDLSRVAVVFPNRRAAMFFSEQLALRADGPVWAPKYYMISGLLGELCPDWRPADRLLTICRLHEVYTEVMAKRYSDFRPEPLDRFFMWGDILASDLDDTDKAMADPRQLFANISGWADFEGTDYLTEEQVKAVKRFFSGFDKESKLKEEFRRIWECLGDIYTRLRQRLAAEGLACEGMIYRRAVEELDESRLRYDKYAFVGFNVLDEVETQLFRKLKAAGRAYFYFDIDPAYMDGRHEAGQFIDRDIKLLGNCLDGRLFADRSADRKVTIVAAPTDTAGAQYIKTWLKAHPTADARERAVALCAEELLPTVVSSLPESIGAMNVTMGFPVRQTPVYGWIRALYEMYTAGYRGDTTPGTRSGGYLYRYAETVLRHPYTALLTGAEAGKVCDQLITDNRFFPTLAQLCTTEPMATIFTPCATAAQAVERVNGLICEVARGYRERQQADEFTTQLYSESLLQAHRALNRITSLTADGTLQAEAPLMGRIIDMTLLGLSVPFHGEPAEGLQIMGILETRNLDFRHLLILSAEEGRMPRPAPTGSMIPPLIRRAYGMTTPEKRNAVYAYYFLRLMQRADTVTIVYNSTTDEGHKGEMSRFALQYLAEHPATVSKLTLTPPQTAAAQEARPVEKTQADIDTLAAKYAPGCRHGLSPSAITTYLKCRLQFYYKHVLRLKEEADVTETIEANTFGTLVHRAAEYIYRREMEHGRRADLRTGKAVFTEKADVQRILADKRLIGRAVDHAFREEYFHLTPDQAMPAYTGSQLLARDRVVKYVDRLLRFDLLRAPFAIAGLELDVKMTHTTPKGHTLVIGGTIDRLDVPGGDSATARPTLRIVDYKTGGHTQPIDNIGKLFDQHLKTRENAGYVLQTFIYAAVASDLLRQAGRGRAYAIQPCLEHLNEQPTEDYTPALTLKNTDGQCPDFTGGIVSDFSLIEQQVLEGLDTVIDEIFDPAAPFTATEHTKDHCHYCHYSALCHRSLPKEYR